MSQTEYRYHKLDLILDNKGYMIFISRLDLNTLHRTFDGYFWNTNEQYFEHEFFYLKLQPKIGHINIQLLNTFKKRKKSISLPDDDHHISIPYLMSIT